MGIAVFTFLLKTVMTKSLELSILLGQFIMTQKVNGHGQTNRTLNEIQYLINVKIYWTH